MDRIEQIKQRLSNTSDGPWSQGRLLLTRQTERWPEYVREEVDAKERLTVFSWFSSMDEGRSRKWICEAKSLNDAEFIANSKMDIQFLLDEVERLQNKIEKLENG